MVRWLKTIIDTAVYSNLFIGLCAVALALTNQLTVEGALSLDYSTGFVFFSTVFTYSLLKLREADKSTISTTHHTWAEQNPQLSKNIRLISLLSAVFFFMLLEWKIKTVVILLGLFTAFYGFVAIPFVKPARKLRDFGLLKTFFVALVWSVITVVVPRYNIPVDNEMMAFLIVRRFLFVLALTMVFEIKDLKSDTGHRLHTLPMQFGVNNTKLLARFVLGLLALILVVQYLFYDLSFGNMIAVNVSLLVSLMCIQPVNEETGDRYYYLVLDGMMILQFALVYASSFFS